MKISKIHIKLGMLLALIVICVACYSLFINRTSPVSYQPGESDTLQTSQAIEILKSSDAIWLVNLQSRERGVLIEDSENIRRIIDSISFEHNGPGACGFQWNLFFMKNGRLLEKTFLVEYCHKNFVTDVGCFAFNRNFKKVLNPYLKRLDHDEKIKYVYDFFFPITVPLENAFNDLDLHGPPRVVRGRIRISK